MKKKQTGKRWIFILLGAVIVIGAVVFVVMTQVIPASAKKAQSAFQTTPAQKGDLTAYIGATGTVRSNQTTTLTWQTSGIIGQIPVKFGQTVAANTVLAGLQQTSLPQTIIMAQSSLVTAQKALDDLMTTNQDRANAELNLVKAQKAYDDAKKARDSKKFQRASQQTIDIARANLILATKALEDAEGIYNHNKNRNADDVVFASALSQLAAAQQRQQQAQYNYDYAADLPDPLDVQTADANVDVAQANLMSAKTAWERVKDGPNEQDVSSAQSQVAAAQATINMAQITAPFGGTLTVVNSKVGDQVNPGSVAFQIDDLTHLYVDVDVSEVDIARISVGQPVTFTFDALTGKSYTGTVTQVAAVGKATAGSVNFTVTAEIANPGGEIKPGMTAAANIVVSQLKNVLLVPNRAIRTQNGQRVVYLMKNNIPTATTITLGASSNTQSEVTGGDLKDGDAVVLNPPSQAFGPGGGRATFGN